MSQVGERTRLLPNVSKPQYVFDTNIGRQKRIKIKQFHCCFLFILLTGLMVIIISIVAYSLSLGSQEQNTTADTPIESFLNLYTKSWPLPDKSNAEQICTNDTAWDEAMAAGQKSLESRNKIAGKIKSLPTNSPSYKHQKVIATTKKASVLSDLGYIEEHARRWFPKNSTKLCHYNKTTSLEYCQTDNSCNLYQKFRSYNGSCNNLKQPHNFGVAYQPFRRALPPDYADGISEPRVGESGKPLPSARTVSLEVHRPYYKDDKKFSVILAIWGQFLDHDITATALSRGVGGASISCCLDNNTVHPECFPVILDSFDPYNRYNVTCMEFVRSAPAPTCCLGARQQMNQVSAFIDASVIYSADEDTATKLRTGEEGKLDMYLTEDNRTLLPVSTDLDDGCNREAENKKGKYCFLTGDGRANENLHLISMHLIWARQHNLVAEQLSQLNPKWNDERVFQESRKILGAQMQHITYKEFLPILLGPSLMERFDLSPRTSGYFTKYDDGIDPSIANNFATAAFRFAHSIIPGLMKFLANDSSSPEFIQLHNMLLDPFKLYQPGELDRALRGAMDTTIEANDPYFTDELQQHLFEDNSDKKMNSCGLDLVSLNIQRGRDHGLVGYNSWREHCGLRRVNTFDQLRGDIDDDSLHNVQSVYRNVDDIDLYTGALSEKPVNGSILGPTLTCLILDQFVRIKYGDRFWYENPNSFTIEQLAEIRKTSLAKIICDNSDNVEETQISVMEKMRDDNPLTPCNVLPEPKWDHWKDSLHNIHVVEDDILVSHVKN